MKNGYLTETENLLVSLILFYLISYNYNYYFEKAIILYIYNYIPKSGNYCHKITLVHRPEE